MQYHHHGYVAHDPLIKDPQGTGVDRSPGLPDTMDVLIVGAGPAGIIQAAQLTNYPGVETRIIESRPSRLEVGRADGLWGRSGETFQAFGFFDRIDAESHRLVDVHFWGPHPEDPEKIARGVRAEDPPSTVTEFPFLIVNQARVIDYYAEYAERGPAKIGVEYGHEFVSLEVEEGHEHPVKVTVLDPSGRERTVRAKYVVGCDGARSKVRGCTDIQLDKDPSAHAWAVMDVLAETDFPDVRQKCGIQSDKHGTILQIPREGGFLVRYYVSLGDIDDTNRAELRATTPEEAAERANRILHPYTLDVKEVTWFSVYEVRHTVAQKFDDVPFAKVGLQAPRVFIAGDACHTHSAKAGQGMNVSMQDGWNIAWKLGQVLEGRSDESLLATYSAERQQIAQELIAFDKAWSGMMSKRPEEFEDPQEIGKFYRDNAEFPNGFATEYPASQIVGAPTHQHLARGVRIGKALQSAPVRRVFDTSPQELGHLFEADGRWRLYAFADQDGTAVAELAEWLEHDDASPVRRFTPQEADLNAVFDAKVVYQQPHIEVDRSAVPSYFLPKMGPFRLTSRDQVFAAEPGDDVFDRWGIDRAGALVIQRPDMYVAHVLPLTAREEITAFFAQSMVALRARARG
ncbi:MULTISPECIES: FAD-dependent monooxygenase [Micrococcus]|uniref:FAD-dependent monooxygenase n=1 Tax=Micrococcus luteus TaxID=1270 RepID=UPI00044B42FF|nr:FAD-dependent monooxygenase [Micrococcus luteus]EZP35305.1 2-polyprenyl-6-methoxyphenol hydroxylase [Micrococcus luteus]MCV7565348.1 FAD-dependent monooxygenase [Micrococcus luteus]MCV7574438.1 FAD-dependent monooxygenase [Micrococcus luteus]MCV7636675.1 FAD-dependent monooxygenase [Micrococcus luteus]